MAWIVMEVYAQHLKRREASSMIGDNNNQIWKDGEIIGRSLETKVTPINECDVRNSKFWISTVVNQSLWWRHWANSGEILVVTKYKFSFILHCERRSHWWIQEGKYINRQNKWRYYSKLGRAINAASFLISFLYPNDKIYPVNSMLFIIKVSISHFVQNQEFVNFT